MPYLPSSAGAFDTLNRKKVQITRAKFLSAKAFNYTTFYSNPMK